jgi:signal transduction histidine kinase
MTFGRYLIFSSVLFVSISVSAQGDLDSLLNEWDVRKMAEPDLMTVNLLLDIADIYRYDNADTALYYSILAKDYSEEINFTQGLANSLSTIGISYYIKGIYDLSLEAHSKALEIHQQLDNKAGMALSLNGISLVHLGRDDFTRAIEYQRLSINMGLNSGDSSLLASNYFNLGIAFDELAQFDSAYHYLDIANTLCNLLGKNRIKLMVNNRLGLTYFHEGKYQQAVVQYKRVLEAEYFQSNWESTFAHSGMAAALVKLGRPQEAVVHGLKAVDFAEKVGAMWDLERAFEILSEAYAANGQFDSAYQTHQLFKQLSDSILSETKEKEINALMIQYHEAENRRLAQVNETQQEQLKANFLANIIFVVVLLSMIAIAFIMYRNNRMKGRLNFILRAQNDDIASQKHLIEEQNAKLEEMNRTNALILSIISHDMRSPIASMQSMIELMRGEFSSAFKEYKVLDELGKRVDNVATMLNNLLAWAGAQFSGIQASIEEVNATTVVKDLVAVYAFQSGEKNIKLLHQTQRDFFLRADLSQFKIIVQNLLSNAIKFTREGGEVKVYYSETNFMTSVHIRDNGVGMTKERLEAIQSKVSKRLTELGTSNEPGTGLGILLVKQFVASNEGSMEIKSEVGKGTEFIISFKKA